MNNQPHSIAISLKCHKAHINCRLIFLYFSVTHKKITEYICAIKN